MNSEEIDFTEDLKTGDINRVIEKAREMYALKLSIDQKERVLKDLKEAYAKMETDELPTIMQEETHADEISFQNGFKLELKPLVNGNIPSKSAILRCKDGQKKLELEERRNDALQWLRDHNAGSLIKNTLVITFPKSEDSEEHVKALQKLAFESGLPSYRDQTVHAQTLNAYLKDQIHSEDGENVPFDTFSVFVGKKAVIKPPKGFNA